MNHTSLRDLPPRKRHASDVSYLSEAHARMVRKDRLLLTGIVFALIGVALGVAGWLYLEGWLSQGLQGGLGGGVEHFVGGAHATYFNTKQEGLTA